MRKIYFVLSVLLASVLTSCSEGNELSEPETPKVESVKPYNSGIPDVVTVPMTRFLTKAYNFVNVENQNLDQEGYENFLMAEFNISQSEVFNLFDQPSTEIPELSPHFYEVLDSIKIRIKEVGYVTKEVYDYSEYLCNNYDFNEVSRFSIRTGLDVMRTIIKTTITQELKFNGGLTRAADLSEAEMAHFVLINDFRWRVYACNLSAGVVGYAASEFVSAAIAAGIITGGATFLALAPAAASIVVGALYSYYFC